MRLTIISIGQTLRNDDGAGLAAVHYWVNAFPGTSHNPSITIEEAELPGINLLNLLEGCDASILVDAVQSNSPPGTIHQLTEPDLLGFPKGTQTAHGWGVAETLQLGHKLGYQLPEFIRIIGIEGENFLPGDSLSLSIQSHLDEAAQVIEDSATIILKQWSA